MMRKLKVVFDEIGCDWCLPVDFYVADTENEADTVPTEADILAMMDELNAAMRVLRALRKKQSGAFPIRLLT